MILTAAQIASEVQDPPDADDPLIITPFPNIAEHKNSGSASIDVRLGCWFLACRPSRVGMLNIYKEGEGNQDEARLTKSYYVPFGEQFVLHTKAFVLGASLEWIRLPNNRAAYVVGRSSWGRRGLIIATATGVHPGFTGCLTLELYNAGEIPIIIKPGTTICQIFIHQVECGKSNRVDRSPFIGMRKPMLGTIKLDPIADKLAKEEPDLGH